MKLKLILIAALALPAFSQSTVKEAMVKHWKITGEFTVKVAEAMPAEGYSSSPIPEEMTFGQVMTHIGAADIGACVAVSGMQRPDEPAGVAAWRKDQKVDVDRATAVEYLNLVFNFCNKAIEATTAEKLDAKVGTTPA